MKAVTLMSCLSNRLSRRGVPVDAVLEDTVGRHVRQAVLDRLGNCAGRTNSAGRRPLISDMPIARRAPFGQNEVLSVMIVSFPSAIPVKVIAAAAVPAAVINSRRFTVHLQEVVDLSPNNLLDLSSYRNFKPPFFLARVSLLDPWADLAAPTCLLRRRVSLTDQSSLHQTGGSDVPACSWSVDCASVRQAASSVATW